MAVEATRHQSIFSPASWGDKAVHIIGAGATGSKIALEVAKLGVQNLHVWDFDVVESHNLANQFYGKEHIGMKKVEALKDVIKQQADIEITAHDEEVTASNKPEADILFLLVDSMEARKEIGGAYKFAFNTQIIETRMGTKHGYIYSFKPALPNEMKAWQETLWEEAVVETSACGTAITVGPTASLISSYAVWQFIKMANTELYDNEMLVCVEPLMIETRQFQSAAVAA